MPSHRVSCAIRLSAVVRAALCLLALAVAVPAAAHPVPFSYLDVRLRPEAIETSLVVHILDVAHELGLEDADRLLDEEGIRDHAGRIAELIARRLVIEADGRRLDLRWAGIEALAERQALRLTAAAPVRAAPGRVAVDARLFPYDPRHKTFVSVYDDAGVAQAILDGDRHRFESFTASPQGRLAVVRTFVPSGIHHILIGPDHILFLVGLLLLGGSIRRLALIVTGFTLAHSVTLSLAVLGVVTPSGRIIEPIIALSIVYVGLDNLIKRDGRDVRAWIAAGFGLIHGFGFASVLRDVGLPPGALGWSLFSFNIGVEIGQLLVVAAVASLMATLRTRNEAVVRRLVVVGSVGVAAAGGFWFLERLGMFGGL